MRILLMLLLLANLGFFAWRHWYGEEAGKPLPVGRAAADVQRLTLIGESETPRENATTEQPGPDEAAVQPERETVSESAADPVAPVPAAGCATLGPFESRDVAGIANVRLESMGFRSAVRESGGQIRSGFWVYLPPFPSRDAAEEIEDALRAKGVHDLFIVAGSDQQNAISLGLFSTPERADQRAAQIGRLGFAPRIAERFRDATVYWVDFIEKDNELLEPESLGVTAAGEPLPEKRDISCDDIAVTEGGA